jgi:kynurenine formamidase
VIITTTKDGREWRFDLSQPLDLSIPLDFNQPQPDAFFLSSATASAVEVGTFVGDTRRGGGANCFDVSLNPHGNGTHTECRGHVLKAREAVTHALGQFFAHATVLSVLSVPASESFESYGASQKKADSVITATALQKAWEASGSEWTEALVLRTLPNSKDKCTRSWSGQNPTYFTTEAINWCLKMEVQHLLVDLPSVDREEDGGTLPNHCLYWQISPEREALTEDTKGKTITEMIYVEEGINDGPYLLELQVPAFVLDAAPSRPVLYAPLASTQET